jgi:hypothetical protein
MSCFSVGVQENYLNHKPSMATSEVQMMQIIAKCADAFSAGDTVNRVVRMKQQWNLMPSAAVLSTVYPAAYIRYVAADDYLSIPLQLYRLSA